MEKKIQKHSVVMAITLALLFIFGMYIAAFVELPETGSVWGSVQTSFPLLLHVIVGCLVPFDGVQIMVIAWKTKQKKVRTVAGLGLLGMVVAMLGGAYFMEAQNELSSFIMALGFLVSIIAYMVLANFKVFQENSSEITN